MEQTTKWEKFWTYILPSIDNKFTTLKVIENIRKKVIDAYVVIITKLLMDQ